jgi:hypothetical protein
MLAYAGKGRFITETFSLSRLVGEMTHLIEVSIPKKIQFRRHLDETIPLIEGYSRILMGLRGRLLLKG